MVNQLSKLVLPHSLAWPSLDILEVHLIPSIRPYYQHDLLMRALLESFQAEEDLEADILLPGQNPGAGPQGQPHRIHLSTIYNPADSIS